VQQGAASSAISVSVTPINGFAGNVQVTLSALPAGVSSNPASPFNVAAGASIPVVFGAAADAATGNFTISAQGVSGALSHSQDLALTTQSGVVASLPRTTYLRTDATSMADSPFGEPHHRHIVYDPSHKQIFLANRAMNRMEVFSSTSQTRLAQIAIPAATSADLSADGSTVWIGTALDEIIAIDSASLTIKNRYTLPGLTPIPNTIFNRPVEVLSLSSGKCLVRLRQPISSEALLALWDPASNSLTNASAVDLTIAGDGTAFAVQANGTTEVHVADLSLSSVPVAPELTQIPGRVFVPGLLLHPSGALIYEPFLTGQPANAGVRGGIDILDAHSGVLRLRIFLPQQFMTDVDGLHGCFLATDENGQRLFAITSSDGTAQNAALTIVQLAAVLLGIGTIQPATVSAAGGATLTIRGSGFMNGTTVTLNGKSATVTFKDANTLSVATPPLTPGAQRLILTNPDGETVSLDAAVLAK
jgi:IPT/TIG domain-containing protein